MEQKNDQQNISKEWKTFFDDFEIFWILKNTLIKKVNIQASLKKKFFTL